MSGIVAGVLLAAGTSSRFGRTKQLARWRGSTLVRRAASTLAESSARPRLAVLGHRAGEVEAELRGLGVEIVVNPSFLDGQSTSVVAAVRALEGRCRGALFVPCDQPLLSRSTLDRLITESAEHPESILRPRYGGRPGAPSLFPSSLFPELLALEGDEGGRQLMDRHRDILREVEIVEVHEGFDVDSPEDLDRLENFFPP